MRAEAGGTAQQTTAGRGGLGESGWGLAPQRKQSTKVWDGERKATRADGEGVKIDQRVWPGRSVITTWQSSQTRIQHYLCSFAFLGCQEGNGTPPAAGLCLAALVPRSCSHGWALLEHSCVKGARFSLSVLLVLNFTCICSVSWTGWWYGQCGLCIDTVLPSQDEQFQAWHGSLRNVFKRSLFHLHSSHC